MTETLSIGIVTYNHSAILERTLHSVLAALPPDGYAHVWVCDNCSTDDSLGVASRVAEADGRVTVISNPRNEGFAHANNRILEITGSSYHVFCNPDITLRPETLRTLIEFLRVHPDVAVACPRVHFEDGRLQPLNKRHPTLWDLFLRRFMPSSLQRLFINRMRRYEMLDIGYEQCYDVPFVSGSFMMCRTNALKDVGGFDQQYFLYLEDADLSRKLQQRGWRTVYCPQAVVTHGWQRAAYHNYTEMTHFCVSVFRYFQKWGWRVW